MLSKFCDLNTNGDIDVEAEKLLNELKNVKIRKILPASNIHSFNVINVYI